jgi:redox-regulated HSP33 family molecular chaperone
MFRDDSKHLREILDKVALKPVTAVDRFVVDFHCRCSREKFLKQLQSLSPTDRDLFLDREVASSPEVSVVCQYCNTEYIFKDVEFN